MEETLEQLLESIKDSNSFITKISEYTEKVKTMTRASSHISCISCS